MSNLLAGLFAVIGSLVVNASLALANVEAGKPPDYSGISYIYYTIIALILGYGIYDTFFKKS